MTNSPKEEAIDRKVWNSLEFCKLAATVLTPLTVFTLGCVIWSGQRDIVQRWEHAQVEQRKAAEAEARERERLRDIRFSIHQAVAPLLNDIFSYHFYVGSWKELTPADWPVPGLEDTELGVFMKPEVGHGTTAACTGVQA